MRVRMSRGIGRPARGIDRLSATFFGVVVTLLAAGTILSWVSVVSGAWTVPVIIVSAVAATGLLMYWCWRFPYTFWRSPRRHRPTTFTQPGIFWRIVIIWILTGCTLPILGAFRDVGFPQVLGSIGLASFFYFWVYVHLWNKANQRERDLRFARIVRDTEAGTNQDFSLYLRPFDSTGTMLIVRPEREFQRTKEPIDTEAVTAEAMESGLPLGALGRPGEQIGAGRVDSTEENWWDRVRLLVNKAAIVFVLPPQSDGSTRREIKWIMADGHIGKCIFLMPLYSSGKWQLAVKELTKLGLNPPDYRVEGALFTFESSGKEKGRLAGAIRLDVLLDNPRKLLRAIQSLHEGHAGISLPPSASNVSRASEEGSRFFQFFYFNVFGPAVALAWLAAVVYLWLQ